MESGWLGGVRGTTGGVADGDTIGVNAICGAGADVSVVEAVAADVNVAGGADSVGGAATIRTATGVTNRVFGEENPTPCTIVIVPESVSYHVQNSLQNDIISIQ
jgi:hypothetical protein